MLAKTVQSFQSASTKIVDSANTNVLRSEDGSSNGNNSNNSNSDGSSSSSAYNGSSSSGSGINSNNKSSSGAASNQNFNINPNNTSNSNTNTNPYKEENISIILKEAALESHKADLNSRFTAREAGLVTREQNINIKEKILADSNFTAGENMKRSREMGDKRLGELLSPLLLLGCLVESCQLSLHITSHRLVLR
jgi:hypothetical protein